ncbi:MAG: glycosyltransferase [Alphaproteobacteria bacterium]
MQVLVLSSSPAHRKTITRVDGLRALGAAVVVAGYERENFVDSAAVTYEYVSLGFAKNRDFTGRIAASPAYLKRALDAARQLPACDVIWANSLDMLVLGLAVRARLKTKPKIVYDVADLSPRQLSNKPIGALVRNAERFLCRNVDALILTSPWFYWAYYVNIVPAKTQVMLLENKISPPAPIPAPSTPAPPWRIVWHGLLRCYQSMAIAQALCKALPGTIDFHAWGYTDDERIASFYEADERLPNFHYHGAYSDTNIAPVFEGAHFLFAFDLDDGANSRLLLPNRLYHSAARMLPMVAAREAAVGRTAEALKLGTAFAAPYAQDMIAFFATLTMEKYQAMREAIAPRLRSAAVYGDDFARIVDDIQSGARDHCLPRTEDFSVVLAR